MNALAYWVGDFRAPKTFTNPGQHLPGFLFAQKLRAPSNLLRERPNVATHNLSPIVSRVVELGDIIKDLTAERDALKEHLANNLAIGTHIIDGWNVIVSLPAPRWSAAGKREFTADHPADEFPELYAEVVELNTKAADEVLTDIERDAYLIPAKRQVTVK